MYGQKLFPPDLSGSMLEKGSCLLVEHYDVVVYLTDGEVSSLPPEAAELLKPMLERGVSVVDMEVVKKFLESNLGEA